MSQNTYSGGAYGELVTQLQTNVAAKTPNLRQPSKLHHRKEGDLDHLVEHFKSSENAHFHLWESVTHVADDMTILKEDKEWMTGVYMAICSSVHLAS